MTQLTVDVLDGLRLLYSGASDEAKPLLKAAMLEIARLRGTEDGRQSADWHRGDGTDDERRFANTDNETQHHDTTTA